MRFVVVGLLNTATTFATIWLLHTRLGTSVGVASAVGYVLGMIQGFLLSRYWPFAGQAAFSMRTQAAGFIAVNLICGAVFTQANVMLARELPLLAASIASTALIVPISFLLYRSLVFRSGV